MEEGLFAQAGAGLEDSLDIYDIDEANREKGEMLGVPIKLFRDKDTVKGIRDKRAAKREKDLTRQEDQEIATKAVPQLVKGGK